MRNFILLFLIILLFGGCTSETPKKQTSALQYFDLKGYMDGETKRLKQLAPSIHKSVFVDDKEESRTLKEIDWEKELSAFSDADINKTAWKDLFIISKTDDAEIYTSDNGKVPVKSLEVVYRAGKVFKIQVLNKNSNMLYNSNDTLSYFPDSLYEIKKTQHIKLLQGKNYRIIGRFK